MRNRILYFYGAPEFNENFKFHLNAIMQKAGLSFGDCFMINIHREIKDAHKVVIKNGKPYYYHVRDKTQEVRACVDKWIKKVQPNHIVVTDPSVCYLVSGDNDSVAQTRGSIYIYSNITVSVVDYVERIRDTTTGKWIAINDWQKCARFIAGQPRPECKFVYKVCRTRDDLNLAKHQLLRSPFITVDSETIEDWISSIQYTGLVNGEIFTWVVPFFNPTTQSGAHWERTGDEEHAWEVVRRIHACGAIKILQNGHYDAAYFIKWRCPLENYFMDTMHAWHCIYAELPKRIDFIASIVVDHYQFWKEESKGEVQDETVKQTSEDKLERFWRYGALDTYYTTLVAIYVIRILIGVDWAFTNYRMQFSLQIGPALNAECRGIRKDSAQFERLRTKWIDKRDKALEKIRIMTDEPLFNPHGSSPHTKDLFYKVLGAKEVKVNGKIGAGDEDTLKMLGEQHVLFDIFAKAILEWREASTEITKYLNIKFRDSRFRCALHTNATDTSRFASGSFMWAGTNGQNLPEDIRTYMVADRGHVLFDIDASQSDARYIAYESQDLKMIGVMESGKDTHCVHAAHFFKETYESILAKVEAKVEKYAHKVTGVRALTKRIVHGTNFQMQGRTLYIRMGGRDAVIAAAKAIGIHQAHKMSYKELCNVCSIFIEAYHELYPRLRPWYKECNTQCESDKRLTTSFGWTRQFFGSVDDPRVQRQIAAFYGQGDTGGNLNRAMFAIYYGDWWIKSKQQKVPSNGLDRRTLDERGVKLLLQVHDSLFGQVPEECVALIREVCDLMELPVTIHGRECVVPAEMKIGFRWSDKCMTSIKRQELEDDTRIKQAFIRANDAERTLLQHEYGVS